MVAVAKELNDFGGFDREVKEKRWRFWPMADGATWEGVAPDRVVDATGSDAYEARTTASLALAQRGHIVAPQDLTSMILAD